MKNITFALTLILLFAGRLSAQYNTLWIPDTLSGTNFNLNLVDTFAQLRPGNQTITAGVNNKFWGPTLFFNQGDTVHVNVHNYLNDSTTLHWHGMHLPAVMDGGPHQIIPPGTIWQPYWRVTNNAATYWYHPHLHEMTQEQMSKGLGGFIIVRDAAEAALPLPRTYGVDDIPLALTSRRYDASNAFVTTQCSYGDYMLTNGTPDAEVSLPKQFVRLRILNAEMERAYNLGFSDNRTFYVITTDGGLVNTPIPVTRLILAVGERVEILVDFGSDILGSSVDMNAYNSGFALGFPGGEPGTTGEFGSLLNNTTFTILHINVASTTSSPITLLPSALVNNNYWTAGDATVTRNINVTNGNPGGQPFDFDNTPFVLNNINKTVNLNTIEQWTITNNQVFGHTFHIHDVEFKLISRSTGALASYEEGWKDVLYLPRSSSATFVARFDDYSDSIHPFMYHCHFSPHEDGGMMGQFVVVDNTSNISDPVNETAGFSLYPNPANTILNVSFSDPDASAYYITINNQVGKTVYMLPRPELKNGIDISRLSKGIYFLQLTDEKTKITTSKIFVKE
ncbi:MAG: multicopper oxidase domain-containing protein [Bacteroidetes bacterium]|nr:multicopper oxidase domain-containing protein [Bacteroidota bacterium]